MIPATHLPLLTAQPYRLYTLLPGPGRKREPRWYSYDLSYRNPDHASTGCVLMWHVAGGRQPYQVALERDERGGLHVHCTCADAVYRGETAGHVCKHVRGLMGLGRREGGPVAPIGFEMVVGGWR